MRILVTGPYSYWNTVAAELLQAEGIDADIFEPAGKSACIKWLLTFAWRKYKYIYHVCGMPDRAMVYCLGLQPKPIILHWIGSDIHNRLKGKCYSNIAEGLYRKIISRKTTLQLSDSPDLLEELMQIGIDAKVVRLLPRRVMAQVEPLPGNFTVLSYWSEYRKLFYRGDWVLRLAGEFPQVRFLITDAQGDNEAVPANVDFLGRIDEIEEIYSQSSVLIRLPEHDSVSAMVLEMLARGRYVIYNKQLPGCNYADSYEQLKAQLVEVMNVGKPNTAGAEFVKTHFSFKEQALNLKAMISGLK